MSARTRGLTSVWDRRRRASAVMLDRCDPSSWTADPTSRAHREGPASRGKRPCHLLSPSRAISSSRAARMSAITTTMLWVSRPRAASSAGWPDERAEEGVRGHEDRDRDQPGRAPSRPRPVGDPAAARRAASRRVASCRARAPRARQGHDPSEIGGPARRVIRPAPLREGQRLPGRPGREHGGQPAVEALPIRSEGTPGQDGGPDGQGQLLQRPHQDELMAQGGIAEREGIGQHDEVRVRVREEEEGRAGADPEARGRAFVAAIGAQAGARPRRSGPPPRTGRGARRRRPAGRRCRPPPRAGSA